VDEHVSYSACSHAAKALSGDTVFRNALDKFCAAASDSATLAILKTPLEGPKT
jgi:hypothetical protein